jgi:hypothetical protein
MISQGEIFVILNLLANATMFVTLGVLIFFIFGRADSAASKFPLLTHWLLKVGLCSMCAGSLFVFFMELENVHKKELPIVYMWGLARNLGNAIILSWVCVFHWKYFVVGKKKQKSTKKKVTKKAKK